jgi:hypothetical protein
MLDSGPMFHRVGGLPRTSGLAALALCVVVGATGCKKKKSHGDEDTVAGSGVLKTVEKAVPPFTSLHLSTVSEGTYTVGEPKVTLRGDDNLLPLIRVESTPDHLVLRQEATIKPGIKLTTDISGPVPTELIVDITARLTVEGLKAGKLTIRTSGTAKLTASGTADEIVVIAAMASQVDFTHLAVRKAKVTAIKAAQVRLGYVEELDVETRAAARVSYMGDPKITRSEGRPPIKQN